MECEDICYDLCAYLDRELDPEKAETVNKHLRICPRCRVAFQNQKCLKELLKEQCGKIVAPDSLVELVLAQLARIEEYRESGIQTLDLIPWGTHIAQLCANKDDYIELMAPYLEAGLEQNELCVWVISGITREEAMEALSEEVPHLQRYIDTGQLQIFSHKEWYLSGGNFDGQNALDAALNKYSEALFRKHAGLRITGNLFWLDQSDWRSFMEYENRLNNAVQNCRLLAICAYGESKHIMDNIDDVVNTHKYVLAKTDGSWRTRTLASE